MSLTFNVAREAILGDALEGPSSSTVLVADIGMLPAIHAAELHGVSLVLNHPTAAA